MKALLLLFTATLWVACTGDATSSGAAPTSTPDVADTGAAFAQLRLEQGATRGDEVDIRVAYVPAAGREAPRMAELRLALSDGLEFVRAEAGDAGAGKRLVAQQPQADRLRLVVFSTENLDTFSAGVLAKVTFRRSGAARIRLLRDKPIFAPYAAEQGLSVDGELAL